MNKINDAQPMLKERPDMTVASVMAHTSEGLMGISALKQYINIRNLQMPSMNYTHYVRFHTHPQYVLEWLLKCNFMPLFFTGNTVCAEDAMHGNFYLQNLDDDIEGLTERYLIQNHDFDGYKALIPADRITPHMVLDFRGFGNIAAKIGHDIVSQYINEVCNYVKEVQDTMETYGSKWDIEKHHNPMITILTDSGSTDYVWFNDDITGVHNFEASQTCQGHVWGWGTRVKTYVRVYTKQES